MNKFENLGKVAFVSYYVNIHIYREREGEIKEEIENMNKIIHGK